MKRALLETLGFQLRFQNVRKSRRKQIRGKTSMGGVKAKTRNTENGFFSRVIISDGETRGESLEQ